MASIVLCGPGPFITRASTAHHGIATPTWCRASHPAGHATRHENVLMAASPSRFSAAAKPEGGTHRTSPRTQRAASAAGPTPRSSDTPDTATRTRSRKRRAPWRRRSTTACDTCARMCEGIHHVGPAGAVVLMPGFLQLSDRQSATLGNWRTRRRLKRVCGTSSCAARADRLSTSMRKVLS